MLHTNGQDLSNTILAPLDSNIKSLAPIKWGFRIFPVLAGILSLSAGALAGILAFLFPVDNSGRPFFIERI